MPGERQRRREIELLVRRFQTRRGLEHQDDVARIPADDYALETDTATQSYELVAAGPGAACKRNGECHRSDCRDAELPNIHG